MVQSENAVLSSEDDFAHDHRQGLCPFTVLRGNAMRLDTSCVCNVANLGNMGNASSGRSEELQALLRFPQC